MKQSLLNNYLQYISKKILEIFNGINQRGTENEGFLFMKYILFLAIVTSAVGYFHAVAPKTMFFFVRHGQTDWNAAGLLQGQADIPLNARGRQEAEALKKKLASKPFSACITSDLQRAFETASIVMADRFLEVIKDSRLRERSYGIFEGRPYQEIDQATDAERATVETRDAFLQRITAYLDDIVHAAHEGNVLIVAHGGLMANLLSHILHIPAHQISNIIIRNTEFFTAYFSDNGWVIEELNGITLPATENVKAPEVTYMA